MQFNPDKHTKSYLLKNPKVAGKLAELSPEFALSELAQDYDILTMHFDGRPLAFTLAIYNDAWINTPATQDKVILTIRSDFNNNSVAHSLSRSKEWMHSEIAKDFDVLSIKNDSGETVALKFAEYIKEWSLSSSAVDKRVLQLEGVVSNLLFRNKDWAMRVEINTPEMLNLDIDANKLAHILALDKVWAKSEIANTFEILSLRNKRGVTVAHKLAKNPSWMETSTHQNFEILSLVDNEGISVAFKLAEFSQTWANTPAAQLDEVLKLKNMNGITVAHGLMANEDWLKTPSSQSIDILKMTDDFGIPVVMVPFISYHGNLFNSHQWFKTTVLPNKDLYDLSASIDGEELRKSRIRRYPPLIVLATQFFTEEILNASNAKDILSLSYPNFGSVSQAVAFFSNHDNRAETILRIINTGASYFAEKVEEKSFFGNPVVARFDYEELAEIVSGAIEIINNEINPVVQARLLIASVSSVNNIVDGMRDIDKNKSLSAVQMINDCLIEKFKANPKIFENEDLYENKENNFYIADVQRLIKNKTSLGLDSSKENDHQMSGDVGLANNIHR